MHPGPLIRGLFGPYERSVAETYRRIFVDLDEFAGLMNGWVPQAQRVLEVGCGEGAMTERLVRTYPAASITAIDITPKVGRLFRGRTANVTFSKETVEDVARREPASFDLVVLADVLHHVPVDARESLMNAIKDAMAPSGSLIFKDWVPSSGLGHWLCDASDRYLTGDDVSYLTLNGIEMLLADIFAPGSIRQIDTIRPWKNNVVAFVKPSKQTILHNAEANEQSLQAEYE